MRRLLCFAIWLSCALTHGAWAGAPKVAATISPVHSLASFLLSGTGGVPELLVKRATRRRIIFICARRARRFWRMRT